MLKNRGIIRELRGAIFGRRAAKIQVHEVGLLAGISWGKLQSVICSSQKRAKEIDYFLVGIRRNNRSTNMPGYEYILKEGDKLIVQCDLNKDWAPTLKVLGLTALG